MAKKKIKLEPQEVDVLDILSAAGVSIDSTFIPTISKFKDVKKTLCKYRGFVRVLRDENSVKKYFTQILKNGLVALDTETNNSLDIHDNKMVGLCLFTPFNRPVYIPIGHKDKISDSFLEGQVSKNFLKTQIELLKDVKIIYHNAKFDINVVRHNFGIQLPLYWDTLIGAKILNENRFSNGLKALYVEGIEPTQVDYHVTTFFEDNEHSDMEDFGLYSAMDSYDTYQVYQWQLKELSAPSMSKLYDLLVNLEFRVTEVCADMEWRGFTFDEKLCDNYFTTESAKLKEMGDKINKLLEPYKDKIIGWRDVKGGRGRVPKLDDETGLPVKKREKREVAGRGGRTFTKWVETDEVVMIDDPYAGVKLEWPVLLTSPQQVLCLLNCILGIQINSTVVDDLKATGNEVAILIGKYRHLNHNLTSFFGPYRELSKGGRIYATFSQMGDVDKTVKTGRFSSKEPNLQQLPARQQEDGVRMLFEASIDVDDVKEVENNKLKLYMRDKVETTKGFVEAVNLNSNHLLITDDGFVKIDNIHREGEYYIISLVSR